MIQCEAFAFNAFQVNTYLIWEEKGQAIVVDPAFYGQEEQLIFESILRNKGLSLTGQINTHCHVDHVLGVQYMRDRHGLPLRAHSGESFIVENVPTMGELFGWKVDPLGHIDNFLEDRQEINLGDYQLDCILVPGHSPGSLAFYSREGGFVISGDVLFAGSIGRTDLPGGDYDTLMESIRDRLLVLPHETTVLPGHGPSSTIGREITGNPFLKEL